MDSSKAIWSSSICSSWTCWISRAARDGHELIDQSQVYQFDPGPLVLECRPGDPGELLLGGDDRLELLLSGAGGIGAGFGGFLRSFGGALLGV